MRAHVLPEVQRLETIEAIGPSCFLEHCKMVVRQGREGLDLPTADRARPWTPIANPIISRGKPATPSTYVALSDHDSGLPSRLPSNWGRRRDRCITTSFRTVDGRK